MQKIELSQEKALQIKCFLKINQGSGIENIGQSQYEILDCNTLMYKTQFSKQRLNFEMYKFGYVFKQSITNQMMVQSLGIVNNLYGGLNQVLVLYGTQTLKNGLLVGSCDNPGIIIELFKLIFYESKQPYQTYSRIYVAFYSTQKEKNCFIDLLLGQRYEFFSRKNFDVHHNFFMKQIQSIRQFLIALKVATTRFEECCTDIDSFVCQISLEVYDQFQNLAFTSQLNLVHTDIHKKTFDSICKRLENISKDYQFKGQDSGNLVNLLEQTIKKSKVILMYAMANQKSQLENSLQSFQIMNRLSNIQFPSPMALQVKKLPEKNLLQRAIQEVLKLKDKKQDRLNKTVITVKSTSLFQQIKQKYESFALESHLKLKNYIQILQLDCLVKKEAYLKIRFPASLEIKEESNIKSYFIARIYKLSETIQKEDMNQRYDKLNTIQNQILISLKALIKQIKKLNIIIEIQKVIDQFLKEISKLRTLLKIFFAISSNTVLNDNISLMEMKNLNIWKIKCFQNIVPIKDKDSTSLSKTYQYSIRRLLNENQVKPCQSSFSNFKKIQAKENRCLVAIKDQQEKSFVTLPKIVIIRKNII